MSDLQQTIERLNDLHTISISKSESYSEKIVANLELLRTIHNAWPAIAAELARLKAFEHAMHSGQFSIVKLQAELSRLEFEAAVRDAMSTANHDTVRARKVADAIYHLDLSRKRAEQHG